LLEVCKCISEFSI